MRFKRSAAIVFPFAIVFACVSRFFWFFRVRITFVYPSPVNTRDLAAAESTIEIVFSKPVASVEVDNSATAVDWDDWSI
jgi:hypothetical protein